MRRAQLQRPGAARAPGRGMALHTGHRGQVAAPGHLHQHGRVRRPARRGPSARPGWAAGRWRRPGRGPRSASSPVGRDRRARAAARSSARATISFAQPVSTSSWASALRASRRPARRRRSSWARVSSTCSACGYGARGSACRSSPSSQIATRPRSATGAKAAARVPMTTRPRRGWRAGTAGTARPARARRAGRRGDPVRAAVSAASSAVEVAGVGHDHDHAASTVERRGGRLGEPGRPVLAGQGGQHRPGRPALGQRGQERRAGRVVRPGRRRQRGRAPGRRRRAPACPRRAGCVSTRACRGRHGEAEHVGEGAGVPVGDRPGQLGDLRLQHRLGRDHPLQEGQPALVLGVGPPVQHEAVDQLPGEADPHPAAGHRRVGQLRRHQVVERPVQVRQRHVDGDAGDRQLGGRLPLALGPCGHAAVLPDPADSRRQRPRPR